MKLSYIYLYTALTLSCIFSQNISSQTLDYSFVVLGCNRVNAADTAGNPSTANIYQLKRVFSEIAAMKPLPHYLFFAGDLVLGYTSDTVQLANELKGWIQLYKQSPLAATGVQLVAMPGNHESQAPQDSATGTKLAAVASERVFVREMNDYILGSNGPHITGLVAGTDSLTTDQSQLTYSFNYHNDHFIILNTDPVGRDYRVPYHWVNNDIKVARQNDTTRHIFAIGHKPAYTSPFLTTGLIGSPIKGASGLDVYIPNRDSLWTAMENYKCEAMFSAHDHLWDSIQPHKGKTWQIIAGNGGSSFETSWSSSPYAFFGYTLVEIYTNDTIKAISMGRNVSKTYYTDSTPTNSTTIRASFILENSSEVTGIDNIVTSTSVTDYPIPNNGNFTMSLKGSDYYSLNIYNLSGQKLLSLTLDPADLNRSIPLDMTMYPNGIYFTQAVTANGAINNKIIIQK